MVILKETIYKLEEDNPDVEPRTSNETYQNDDIYDANEKEENLTIHKENRKVLQKALDKTLDPMSQSVLSEPRYRLFLSLVRMFKTCRTIISSTFAMNNEIEGDLHIERLYLFCLIWTFGGLQDIADRKILCNIVKNLFNALSGDGRHTCVFVYYLDESGKWDPWTFKLLKAVYSDNQDMLGEVLVPSVDMTKPKIKDPFLEYSVAFLMGSRLYQRSVTSVGTKHNKAAAIQYRLVASIEEFSSPKEMEHFKIKRCIRLWIFQLNYEHHFILKCWNDSEKTIIEYNSSILNILYGFGKIEEKKIELKTLLKYIERKKLYQAVNLQDEKYKAWKRYSRRLGETKYNLFCNNCEHFASHTTTGNPSSQQIRQLTCLQETIAYLSQSLVIDLASKVSMSICHILAPLPLSIFMGDFFENSKWNLYRPEDRYTNNSFAERLLELETTSAVCAYELYLTQRKLEFLNELVKENYSNEKDCSRQKTSLVCGSIGGLIGGMIGRSFCPTRIPTAMFSVCYIVGNICGGLIGLNFPSILYPIERNKSWLPASIVLVYAVSISYDFNAMNIS